MADPRAWYFLSFGSQRQYGGNLGYNDDPERIYRYDSFVANHRNVSIGDLAVIVERDGLLGFGKVGDIQKKLGSKELRRCPVEKCSTTSIKERTTLTPRFRCHHGHTFDQPMVDVVDCNLYSALLSGFIRAKNSIPLEVLRRACPRYTDQLAIQELDFLQVLPHAKSHREQLLELLAEVNFDYMQADEADDWGDPGSSYSPTGVDNRPSANRQIKFRRGQARFRTSLIRRYGPKCQVTRCSVLDVVEAAHIDPYRGDTENHPENGLLLRADLHTLFDLDLIGVNPENLTLVISRLVTDPEYQKLQGMRLICGKRTPNYDALARRWTSFSKRLKAD